MSEPGPPAAPETRAPRRRSFYEPASGAVILGVDWLCFGLEWELPPFTTAAMSLVAFGATTFAVAKLQRKAGDAPRVALAKALCGGLAAGVPFPVTGTVFGGLILALSGLKRR